MSRSSPGSILCFFLSACTCDPAALQLDAGPPDAGRSDAAAPDATLPDAGSADAGLESPAWAVHVGGPLVTIEAVALGEDGSAVAVGLMNGTVDFGGVSLTSAGSNDGFVAAFGADGSLRWARGFGGPGNDGLAGAAVTSDGRILVAGHFRDSVSFGAETRSAAGGWDGVIFALTPEGDLDWLTSFGGAGDEQIRDLAADATRVCVTGDYDASFSFGASTPAAGQVFTACADLDGSPRWAARIASTGEARALALALDRVVTTGRFRSSSELPVGSVTSAGAFDGFVVASSATAGAADWQITFGGTSSDSPNAIAADSSGRLYVVGDFQSVELELGGTAHGNAGGSDVFVLALAEDGTARWSTTFGGSGFEGGHAVTVTRDDRPWIGGAFEERVSFDAALEAGGPAALGAFLAELDPMSGEALEVGAMTGPDSMGLPDLAAGPYLLAGLHGIVDASSGSAGFRAPSSFPRSFATLLRTQP